ncbi:hypothetical protein [uncultured Sphaerochaeta sp.]|uniref:hypothetical protein n=1 Tax=uncultured Sphaerochaeta sp. TaxID=886478 RepID=UPI002A0A1DDF|nr:hypothetical protein [uncultured Sphaerochaeta sp.]
MTSVVSMLYADLVPVATLVPSFTYSTISDTGLTDEQETVESYKLYAELPPLIDMGFKFSANNFDLVGIVDFHQKSSILSDSDGYLWFKPQSGLSMDNNSPRVGYAETRYKGFLGSFGRRKLEWGPGMYDLAISDNSPYYDHLWLQYRVDETYGSWWYQFLATNFGSMYSSENAPIDKTLFAHKIGFENRQIRATISEIAMTWSDSIALSNWIPFGVWQSTAHETANVMIEATCEGLVGPARIYGSFVVSDSAIVGSLEENPSALGAMLGFSWHFFDGTDLVAKQDDFGLRENTFKNTQGGLTVGAECYYTSNYLYNSTSKEGTFTAPLKQFAYAGALNGDSNAYFLGFPYGPGAFLTQVMMKYEQKALTATAIVGILLKDEATIDMPYTTENGMSEFALTNSDVHVQFTAKGSWALKPNISISALLKEDFNATEGTSSFVASFGAMLKLSQIAL